VFGGVLRDEKFVPGGLERDEVDEVTVRSVEVEGLDVLLLAFVDLIMER
jgi:hypothetical protein